MKIDWLVLKPWVFVIAINAFWLSIYRYCLIDFLDWELVVLICFINIPLSIFITSKIYKKQPVLILLILSLALFFISKRQLASTNSRKISISADRAIEEKPSSQATKTATTDRPSSETLPIHERLAQFKKHLDCEKLLEFAKEVPSIFEQEEDAINLLNKCEGKAKIK